MRYEFFDKGGVAFVRIFATGGDGVERPATDADHEIAERENAAEDAALAQIEAATKERIERENAAEARALGKEPDEPTQKQLELESDALLAAELEKHGDDEANGKHKKARKGAE